MNWAKGRHSASMLLSGAMLACLAGLGQVDDPAAVAPKATPVAAPEPARQHAKPLTPHVLEFKVKRIDGTEQDLAAYHGKVVLIVNVASKCGLTSQYQGLQELFDSRKDKGFVVLGFPANDFGKQEPGSNEQIAEFCSKNYGVTFPMFEKIAVKGDSAHPLYKRLIAQPSPIGGDPKWNFTKFLVDRSGNVVARFEPRTKPDDSEMLARIDELLRQAPAPPAR